MPPSPVGTAILGLLVAGRDALHLNAVPHGTALAATAGIGGTYGAARLRERAAVSAILVDGAASARSLADERGADQASLLPFVAIGGLLSVLAAPSEPMGVLKASRKTGSGSTLGLGLYSNFYSKIQKGCCRGLYSGHGLSHGPISIQQLYSSCIGCIAIQLYSSYTVYILYSIPLHRMTGVREPPHARRLDAGRRPCAASGACAGASSPLSAQAGGILYYANRTPPRYTDAPRRHRASRRRFT